MPLYECCLTALAHFRALLKGTVVKLSSPGESVALCLCSNPLWLKNLKYRFECCNRAGMCGWGNGKPLQGCARSEHVLAFLSASASGCGCGQQGKKRRRMNFCRTFSLENRAKGACVVLRNAGFSLLRQCFSNKEISYFSWGSSQVTPYGGCQIMDHLGNLVHLGFPCFVVIFVFKQGFGTLTDKLVRKDSQRGFFCLDTSFPTDFPCFRGLQS